MKNEKPGPAEVVQSVAESLKGKVKEAVGGLSGKDDPTREGAQPEIRTARREAAEKDSRAHRTPGDAAGPGSTSSDST